MALLRYCDRRNLVIDEAPKVEYSTSEESFSAQNSSGEIVNYTTNILTRTKTASFRYTGVDYETAVAAQTVLQSYYTRTQRYSIRPDSYSDNWTIGEGGTVCIAAIAARHTSGEMWDVVVQLNETASRRKWIPPSINDFDYEGELPDIPQGTVYPVQQEEN